MKQMWHETLVIVIITLIAGLGLGVVYEITKDPIAKSKLEKTQKAYQEVFSEADQFIQADGWEEDIADGSVEGWTYENADLEELLYAMNGNGEQIGYVMVITAHDGYNGDITFTLGITLEGKTNGISLTEISETAGLGMEAEDVLVPQFVNKEVDTFAVTKQDALYPNQIEAISGATFTTNAITNGVNAGLTYYYDCLGGTRHE